MIATIVAVITAAVEAISSSTVEVLVVTNAEMVPTVLRIAFIASYNMATLDHNSSIVDIALHAMPNKYPPFPLCPIRLPIHCFYWFLSLLHG
jgi:hypothetical protein